MQHISLTHSGCPFLSGSFSLAITQLNIEHLGLRSLREISDGDVVITNNPNLCYTKKRHWKQLFKLERQTIRFDKNADAASCGKWFTPTVFTKTKVTLRIGRIRSQRRSCQSDQLSDLDMVSSYTGVFPCLLGSAFCGNTVWKILTDWLMISIIIIGYLSRRNIDRGHCIKSILCTTCIHVLVFVMFSPAEQHMWQDVHQGRLLGARSHHVLPL